MRMKINVDLIRRCSSKHVLSVPSGDDPFLRMTHLYLQEQHIKKIENLESCPNIVALYLYDNRIELIENLECLHRLSCLYLQKNVIKCIENLDYLTRLTVLNLGNNAIQRVEGLESLCGLRELYIQYQSIPEGQCLEFDSSSIKWLSECLRVLNVSGNRLPTLSPLQQLHNLEVIQAEENELSDLADLVESVSCWGRAVSLKLAGNPVCALRKYRDSMVVACLELEELDGKVISQSYRNFLLNWKQFQHLQDRKKESYAVLKPFLETPKREPPFEVPVPTCRAEQQAADPSQGGSVGVRVEAGEVGQPVQLAVGGVRQVRAAVAVRRPHKIPPRHHSVHRQEEQGPLTH